MKNTNLILGSVGSGKTRGVMFDTLETLIQNDKNLFIIDNKEEYYPRFQKELAERGYQVKVINFLDTSMSNGWNLLRYPYELYQSKNIDVALSVLRGIAMTLCKNNSELDSFWENTAADFFMALVLILFKEGQESEIHFYSLAQLLIFLDVDTKEHILKMREYLQKLDVNDPIYRLASSTVFSPIETRSGILSTLKTLLSSYLGFPGVMNVLSSNDLDISKLEGKVAIFFMSHGEKKKMENLLLEQLLMYIKKNHVPFVFAFDNLNKVPTIPFIEEFTEYARQNQTFTYFITNHIEELKSKYPQYTFDNMEEVIDCDSLEYLEIDEQEYQADYPSLEMKGYSKFDVSKIF